MSRNAEFSIQPHKITQTREEEGEEGQNFCPKISILLCTYYYIPNPQILSVISHTSIPTTQLWSQFYNSIFDAFSQLFLGEKSKIPNFQRSNSFSNRTAPPFWVLTPPEAPHPGNICRWSCFSWCICHRSTGTCRGPPPREGQRVGGKAPRTPRLRTMARPRTSS